MRFPTVLALLVAVPLLQGCPPALIATGVGTGVMLGEDRRTAATVLEDQSIELKTENRIGERFKDQVHVNVTSFNRMVLLTGEAATNASRAEIEKITRAIENVRGIYNEIAVVGNSSISSRTNDAYLTGKVKARFVDGQKFNAVHVKVVTESNTVYLLGMVNRKEADTANTLFDFIFSGAFEKYPKLKLLLSESEVGWAPFMLQQWDYYWDRFRRTDNLAIKRAPSEIFTTRTCSPTKWNSPLG